MGEWLIPADCKFAAERLRRFESCPLHQGVACPDSSAAEHVLGKNEVPSSILGLGSKTKKERYARRNNADLHKEEKAIRKIGADKTWQRKFLIGLSLT